jgi:hypothetical protein
MSRPTFQEAVLLAAHWLYHDVEKSWEQPVLLRDVSRAVARTYGLPNQDPTQEIDVRRLEESKMVRRDGQDLDLTKSDERVPLEQAVGSCALWLRNHGYAETYVRVNDVMRLTEAGSKKAEVIGQAQLLVDAGIKGRIQQYDNLNAHKDDSRLRLGSAVDVPAPFDRSPRSLRGQSRRPRQAPRLLGDRRCRLRSLDQQNPRPLA